VAQSHVICSRTACTFALTGTCLEGINEPGENCPHLSNAVSLPSQDTEAPATEGSDAQPSSVRQFPSGMEVGLHDVSTLMCSRYAKIIGVLGQIDAGKTSLFTSLYLRLTNRYLFPQYRFAGSLTLPGFENRARHLRDWTSERIPDQIVDHTILGSHRAPAFLHLAIQEDNGARHELILPDLPGEWTSGLLSDAAARNRFEFLHRSDMVLITLEASLFADRLTRHNALTDARQLFTRLSDDIQLSTDIPLIIAVTKCDKTSGKAPSEIQQVIREANNYGYDATMISTAAFPDDGSGVQPGFGIDCLLKQLTSPTIVGWNWSTETDGTGRSFLAVRGSS